jgi:mRNA-degrading endonuclease RelE of RelBE toxin-antitoxin system
VAKRIVWTEQARADVRAMDRETAISLLHGFARFVATEEGDVKRLQGIEPPELRLRLGDYRVRFRDLGDSIEILRFRHRKDVYRWVVAPGRPPNRATQHITAAQPAPAPIYNQDK